MTSTELLTGVTRTANIVLSIVSPERSALGKGSVYVLYDTHYTQSAYTGKGPVICGDLGGKSYPKDRRQFLEERSQEEEFIGFIPISDEALKDVQELGMERQRQIGSGPVYLFRPKEAEAA